MIDETSRYAQDTTVQRVAAAGKSPTLAVYRDAPIYDNVSYRTVISQQFDSFSTLADKFYSDPSSWWIIADANPHVFFPGLIPPGSIIRIPRQ